MELDHERLMGLALEEARSGALLGNTFVGAVIVREGVIVGRGHNAVISERNPLMHAETVAIANGCRALGTAHLAGATLYSTLEPCPMCLWAIHRAGIECLVLGGRHTSTDRTDLGDYSVERLLRLTHQKLDLVTGVRTEECERLRREQSVLQSGRAGLGMATDKKKSIDEITTERNPHHEPYGWHHWPDHPWMSYQFRRGLGETQEGGGAVSECFQAASRMISGDRESWHVEWLRVADRNHRRGGEAEHAGHIRTAMNCWLRAADYYRQAEFWLDPEDPRRLATFEKCERCSHKFLGYLNPPGEVIEVPYEGGKTLFAYFVRAPFAIERQPVLISLGGLDSYKDEMWFMQAHGGLQRGISVLMVDGPGQGGTLRRHKLTTRYDYEVPVGRCIDYLATRRDVDMSRIAVCGSSLGGYYAARAGSFEHRLAACISHGAIWSVHERWKELDDNYGLAGHIKWVFGAKSMEGAVEFARPFTLEGALERMRCPYLIVHGGHDVLGVEQATKVFEYAKAKGVAVTLRFVTEEETGAEHCQHDNPTIGQELMVDWLVERFGIDERELLKKSISPLV